MAITRVGGSFAPPLPPEKLADYKALAASAPEQVGEAMGKLIAMLEKFRETPRSALAGHPHPSGRGVIVPLEATEVKRIWDHVPWKEELAMWAAVFETIDAHHDKALRDAAFHLLWYGNELCLDREPITADQL